MGVRVNASALTAQLTKLDADIRTLTTRALREHGSYAANQVKRTRFTRYPGPGNENPSRSRLYGRSSALARSVASRITGEAAGKTTLTVSVGDGLSGRYVRLQEYGGTIRGKPWLTIPLPLALTAAGRPRYERARSVPDGFVYKAASGNLFIASNARTPGKKEGKLGLYFILRRSVRIPPRLGFVASVTSARVARDRQARVRNALRDAITRTFGRGAI